MNRFHLIAATLALFSVSLTAQSTAPDIIYFHGDILTGAHLKSEDNGVAPARISAVAIKDGRIIATGADKQLLTLKGEKTLTVDLHGAFAMPGFNDAHTHIAGAGQQRLSVDLDGTASLSEMQARIRTYVAKAEPGQWILGGGWDHTKWPSKTLPTRQDLDSVTAGHPAFLYRVDGHIAVANTAALDAANIHDDTSDPSGGKFDRAKDGRATGIVRENPALALIQKQIPKPSFATRRKALELSIADALAHGVTSVQDFSDWDDWLVLEEMEHTGKLHLRVSEWLDFNLPLSVLQQRRASHSADDPLLHLGMLKAFMDGSLGSRTAALNAPYVDDGENSGIPRYEQEKLNELATARAAAGFQLGFHAIGDKANDMALDAFEAGEQVAEPPIHTGSCPPDVRRDSNVVSHGAPCDPNYQRDFRYRIEHAQVVSPDAFDRFHELGVIASMQPSHLLTDMEWAGDRLGPERSRRAYAWRSFLTHGVTLAFGTDYPVESISPFRGLYAATTRMNEAGTKTFEPRETLTINEAVYAYTQASAYAEFRERLKGRLEPGFLADIVVLDRDITKAGLQDLLRTQVLRTIVGGVTVFTSDSLPQSVPPPHALPEAHD